MKMHWQKKQFQNGSQPTVIFSSQYEGDNLAWAVENTVVLVSEHITAFQGCAYLVYMWDSVNAMLVVFGEAESGDLASLQIETAFITGQQLLEQDPLPFELLDNMANEIRQAVFSAVQQSSVQLTSGFSPCFLFDRTEYREDYELISAS